MTVFLVFMSRQVNVYSLQGLPKHKGFKATGEMVGVGDGRVAWEVRWGGLGVFCSFCS